MFDRLPSPRSRGVAGARRMAGPAFARHAFAPTESIAHPMPSLSTNRRWDFETDLLVAGAGAAGMTAALVGAIEGLRTILCEKSDMVGGTTATSAGTVWIPGSRQAGQAGLPDTSEAARTYLAAILGEEANDARLHDLSRHRPARARLPRGAQQRGVRRPAGASRLSRRAGCCGRRQGARRRSLRRAKTGPGLFRASNRRGANSWCSAA